MSLRILSRRARDIAGGGIVIGLVLITAWSFAISWHPSPKSFVYQGVDVSADDKEIDWPVMRGNGVSFAYLTATVGADVRDPMFEGNWAAVYAAGIRRGAIHVYSLCRLAADQANNFNTTVPYTSDSLPPAILIDFENDCAARPERAVVIGEIERLLTIVEAHSRAPALLKVSRRFDSRYNLTQAIPRPIWSMQNFFPPDYAARPWRMWQANDRRRVDGAPTLIHWNVVAP